MYKHINVFFLQSMGCRTSLKSTFSLAFILKTTFIIPTFQEFLVRSIVILYGAM